MNYINMLKGCSLFLLTLSFLSHSAQTVDNKGRKQGYWKKYDENSKKLIYEGEFRDDKPVGKFKYYYPNDSVRAVLTFRAASPVSYARLFHPGGKRMAEGKYIDRDVKDSVWTFYDEEGILLSRETYVKGKKEGVSYVYLPDGSLSEEKIFLNGLEKGPFKQYFDGKLVKSQGTYKDGKLEGRMVYFYPNGVEAAAGFYRAGLKNGPWIYRDKEGKITERELYENGELATQKETADFFKKHKTEEPAPKKTQKNKGAADEDRQSR